MANLTQDESRWIARAKRLLREQPQSLRVYCLDHSLVCCKEGVPSSQVDETLGDIIDAGVYLADMHDDRL